MTITADINEIEGCVFHTPPPKRTEFGQFGLDPFLVAAPLAMAAFLVTDSSIEMVEAVQEHFSRGRRTCVFGICRDARVLVRMSPSPGWGLLGRTSDAGHVGSQHSTTSPTSPTTAASRRFLVKSRGSHWRGWTASNGDRPSVSASLRPSSRYWRCSRASLRGWWKLR